jgi:hypothetical protein
VTSAREGPGRCPSVRPAPSIGNLALRPLAGEHAAYTGKNRVLTATSAVNAVTNDR